MTLAEIELFVSKGYDRRLQTRREMDANLAFWTATNVMAGKKTKRPSEMLGKKTISKTRRTLTAKVDLEKLKDRIKLISNQQIVRVGGLMHQ